MIEWAIILTLIFPDGSRQNVVTQQSFVTLLGCQTVVQSQEYRAKIAELYRGRGIDLVYSKCQAVPVIYHES